MEKFQDIFGKAENVSFEKMVFLSDTPVEGVQDGVVKEVLPAINSKDLLAMIKLSLPAEALAGMGWGKSFSNQIEDKYKIDVALTAEKKVRVEICKIDKPSQSGETVQTQVLEVESKQVKQEQAAPVEAPTTPPTAAPAAPIKKQAVIVEPEVLDNLMQADALIYYVEQEPKQIVEFLSKAGYEVRTSKDPDACVQALNYKDFPVVGLFINSAVFSDAVFLSLHLTNMVNRRKQFSFLVSDGLETANPDLAFSFSVSFVLDSSAINSFESNFTKNLQSWKRVVDPFVEVLSAKM